LNNNVHKIKKIFQNTGHITYKPMKNQCSITQAKPIAQASVSEGLAPATKDHRQPCFLAEQDVETCGTER